MKLFLALWLLLAPVFAQAAAPVPVLYASQPYVLDQLSSYPAVAFSVRQLTASKYDPAYDWLVRRSSDNTQTQIGFVGGLLNTTALASFCAGTNCYLVTWKNQGSLGSSGDATQSTAANQPQVVASGVVETQGGLPAVLGLTSNLVTTASMALTQGSVVCGLPTSANSYQTLINNGNSSVYATSFGSSVTQITGGNSATLVKINGTSLNGTQLSGWNNYYAGFTFTSPGILQTQGNAAPSAPMSLFNNPSLTTRNFTGKIQEFVGWTSQNANDLRIVDLNQAAFYGITGVTQ